MTHITLTQTVLFSCILILTIVGAGCTSLPQPNTNTTTITITNTIPSIPPTPNPYGLDTDGYYIADFGFPKESVPCFDRTDYTYDEKLKKTVMTFNNTPNFTVKLLTPTITSGEALLFEGITTCPPHSRVYIMKDPHDCRPGVGGTGVQEFSAPVLPGTNGTNIIKFKIPAFNIHIDASTRKEPSFPANETYTSYISVGTKSFEFTIISDPNHPMIWDTASRSQYTWMWTNDTTKTKYTTYFQQLEHGKRTYNRSEAKPAPTYPKLNNTFR
jgi:hypothetical protein